MKKFLLFCSMCLCFSLTAAKGKKEDVQDELARKIWISVYQDGQEYWGSINEDTLAKLNKNRLLEGFIKLKNVHWVNPRDNSLMNIVSSKVANERDTYTGTVFMSVTSIKNIIVLNPKRVAIGMNKEFRKEKEAKKKKSEESNAAKIVRSLVK